MTMGVECPKCGLLQLPGRPARPARRASQFAHALRHHRSRDRPRAVRGSDPARTRCTARVPWRGWLLLGIHIVNVLLTIVTLGVYYFWAKVRVRSYILSQTECAGDRFAYHGTGRELLLGFVKAVLLIGIPFLLLDLGIDLVTRGPVAQAQAVFFPT